MAKIDVSIIKKSGIKLRDHKPDKKNKTSKNSNSNMQKTSNKPAGYWAQGKNNKQAKLFPYGFIARPTYSGCPPLFHDKLLSGHFDIAFDIEWEVVTPTALNPCIDPNKHASYPEKKGKISEYSGFNKRWLLLDSRPAISPFTVKSAVANGFANLMGGCYRVTENRIKTSDRQNKFFHEDAVPADQKLCRNDKKLCPRCRLFGLVFDEKATSDGIPVGLRGRFKSSTMVSSTRIESNMKNKLSNWPEKDISPPEVIHSFDGENKMVLFQDFLPVLAEPKPTKLDINGYFDPNHKTIKGAKTYKHFMINMHDFDEHKKTISKNSQARMRSYAQVCVPGLVFHGTVGVENCCGEEAAALMALFSYSSSGHGFKLGLGKSLGMGSAKSKIKGLWIRSSQDYQWQYIKVDNADHPEAVLDKFLPGFSELLQKMVKKHCGICKLTSNLVNPKDYGYPKMGNRYWDFANLTFNKL